MCKAYIVYKHTIPYRAYRDTHTTHIGQGHGCLASHPVKTNGNRLRTPMAFTETQRLCSAGPQRSPNGEVMTTML
jgi:hypothetical protein